MVCPVYCPALSYAVLSSDVLSFNNLCAVMCCGDAKEDSGSSPNSSASYVMVTEDEDEEEEEDVPLGSSSLPPMSG